METTTMQAVETAEEIIEKTYTLRSVQAKDAFLMSKIISKIGIDELKTCFESEDVKALVSGSDEVDADALASKVGAGIMLDLAGIILSNLPKAEKDIYTFLSNLSGMTVGEIEAMPLTTFAEMVIDVVQKDDFKDFIGVVSKLFK